MPRDADAKAIKDAFRRLARRYDPDTSTEPDAGEQFKEIAEAYGVLSDPARRRDYDASGLAGLVGASPEDLWGGIDFADVFGAASGFGNLFGRRLFGHAARGAAARRRHPGRGGGAAAPGTQGRQAGRHDPAARTLPVMLGQWGRPGTAARPCVVCAGTGQRASQTSRGGVTIRQVAARPDCWGRGSIIDDPCPDCQPGPGGRLRVTVPPGTQPGAIVRIAGRSLPATASAAGAI